VILLAAGRQKDRRDQRGARHYRPGPEGSQGPGRFSAQTVKEGIAKEEAEKIKAQLEEAGAQVELK
jgi:hypothetical protein